jgi:hypothetical protein
MKLLVERSYQEIRFPLAFCSSKWPGNLAIDSRLTLFHLPSRTAFTIRAWSRRTVRQTFFQGMEFQSGAWSGAAPTGVAVRDRSALLPESVGQGFLVTEDPREVCPLSGGVMSPCSSTPIQPVLGWHSLSPSSFTRRPMGFSCELLSLAGRATGLPRFVAVSGWGGSQLFAGGTSSAPVELAAPGPDHVPFWPERDSILRSFLVTAFIAASHPLTRPPDPGPRPR